MNAAGRALVPAPRLIVMGASTGGVRILGEIVSRLPCLRACLVIVQHMPKFINASFVRTLGNHAQAEVRLAQDGDRLAQGLILVAPSEVHCRIVSNRWLQLAPGPSVNYVCPSIDVTMQSVGPSSHGSKPVGVLLTGMGRDGADGMAHLKALGGITITQNESTCAVYGMPAEAVRLGCVDFELPPAKIADFLAREC
jgi:two-component system, chemotaxis family, protein-glutamate methylesterase/glutaminase